MIDHEEIKKMPGVQEHIDKMEQSHGRPLLDHEKEIWAVDFWIDSHPDWKVVGKCKDCGKKLKKKDIGTWGADAIWCMECSFPEEDLDL